MRAELQSGAFRVHGWLEDLEFEFIVESEGQSVKAKLSLRAECAVWRLALTDVYRCSHGISRNAWSDQLSKVQVRNFELEAGWENIPTELMKLIRKCWFFTCLQWVLCQIFLFSHGKEEATWKSLDCFAVSNQEIYTEIKQIRCLNY